MLLTAVAIDSQFTPVTCLAISNAQTHMIPKPVLMRLVSLKCFIDKAVRWYSLGVKIIIKAMLKQNFNEEERVHSEQLKLQK